MKTIILIFLSFVVGKIQAGLPRSSANMPKYRVAIAMQAPYIEKYQLSNGQQSYRGLTWDLWESIIEHGFGHHVNFTYTEMPQYPMYPDDRGQLGGQIGALVKGTVDIALGPFMHSPQAEQFVDFSMPYTPPVGLTIVHKSYKGDDKNLHMGTFMRTVLYHEAWLLICAAYLVLCCFWLVLFKADGYFWLQKKACQSSPCKMFSKLMLGSWFLFFLVLVGLFSEFSSKVNIAPAEYPIKSFDDLHRQYKIKFSTSQNSAALEYFKIMAQIEEKTQQSYMNSFFGNGPGVQMSQAQKSLGREYVRATNSKYQRIWRMMQETGILENAHQGIQKVLKGDFAYVGDTNEIRYADMTNCDLETAADVIGEWPMVLAVQQGSPLINVINTAILKMLNQRQLLHLQEKWWKNNKNRKSCDAQNTISHAAVTRSVLWIFCMLAISMALAAAASALVAAVTGILAHFLKQRGEKKQEEKIQNKKLPPLPPENDYVDFNDNIL